MDAGMKDNSDKKLGVLAPLRENFLRLGWLLLFWPICLSVSLSYAEGVEEKLWSFKFKDCAVSDAFKQITKTSGIKITSNVPIDTKISKKAFKNKRIAQVLRNLLRGKNYVMVWHQDDKGAYSIHISILDQANQKRGKGSKPPQQTVSVIHVGGSKDVREKAGTPSSSKGTNKANIKEGQRSSPQPTPQSGNRPIITGATDSPQSSTPDKSEKKDTASLAQKQTSAPPQPAPEKTSGLEPPPMPPGVK